MPLTPLWDANPALVWVAARDVLTVWWELIVNQAAAPLGFLAAQIFRRAPGSELLIINGSVCFNVLSCTLVWDDLPVDA